MKTFRAFGPTIGKGKLSRKFINTINAQIDKSIITKKNDYYCTKKSAQKYFPKMESKRGGDI